MNRRTLISGVLALSGTMAVPALAQSTAERRKAQDFLRGLLGAARSRSRNDVEQYIRQNVDLQYGYEKAFSPWRVGCQSVRSVASLI